MPAWGRSSYGGARSGIRNLPKARLAAHGLELGSAKSSHVPRRRGPKHSMSLSKSFWNAYLISPKGERGFAQVGLGESSQIVAE
jgi:hypothetical protein